MDAGESTRDVGGRFERYGKLERRGDYQPQMEVPRLSQPCQGHFPPTLPRARISMDSVNVVNFWGSYHGLTASMSASGPPRPSKNARAVVRQCEKRWRGETY